MEKNIHIFGEPIIDSNSIEQLKRCVGGEDIGVLTPDAHKGYQHPIGGAVAYRNHISVSGVGFDIGCGNKAVKTNVLAEDINVAKVMDEVFRRISFGVGRVNDEPIDHEVLDKIAHAEFIPQRKLIDKAATQLGTVGSGNHYVDLFKGQDGYLWVGVHFGSRGFGHTTASGFISLSQGKSFTDKGKESGMDDAPILFDMSSDLGQAYYEAMHLAGEYAYAGRDIVVDKVLELLGAQNTFEVHNHHNFAWQERHFGKDYFVVRKGCTPAWPDQYGFIGSNMFDNSVIVKGIASAESETALYSTVHGAGRVMSRTQAAGKKRWVKDATGKKIPKAMSGGLVDFTAVQQEARNRGIELRGAGADEAPQCYKKLTEVLEYMSNNVEIVEQLVPIGVAMAGINEFDPYKD